MHPLREEAIGRETIFEGRVFSAHVDKVRLPDDREATREVVEHHGGVAVVAVDGEDMIFLVRQFRYGVGETLLELPAGKLEAGESPAECGIRELQEETGMAAGSFEPLCSFYPTPAYCSERIHIFVATHLQQGVQNLDVGEFLSVERIPFAQAHAMCLDGSITDAKTLIGILKYAAIR